jgi:hypothetical protein
MEDIELRVLQACQEVVVRNNELFPLLETAVGVKKQEVFYAWALRKCKQRGNLTHTPWSYYFHGLECDLKNLTDGRFLRIEFGPEGRIDTFSGWGVLQFIMTSVPPWSQFNDLKNYFTKSNPPFNQFSGDFDKFSPVWDKLEDKGYFEVADEKLIQLQEHYIHTDSEGIQHVKFPPDISERTQIDSSVAHRKTLSRYGHQILKSLATIIG